MRPQAAPAPPKYVYSDFPRIMYPSTERQARGLTRIATANSAEEEAALEAQGYQRTQAAEPMVAPTATKEEAMAKQQAQFDAAWDKKVAELNASQNKVEALEHAVENLKAERDALNKRLAKLTVKREEVLA